MYKVMIVDDETVNYQLFEKLVNWEEKGFELAGYASDGLEALQKYEELQPDLIFMDIQLPLQDGLESIRCIREVDEEVKIVIVSAYGDFNYAQKAIRYGVQDFLLKPVSRMVLNQLVDKIRSNLDMKRETKTETCFDNELSIALQNMMTGKDHTVIPDTVKLLGVTVVGKHGNYMVGDELKQLWTQLLQKEAMGDIMRAIATDAKGHSVIAVNDESDFHSILQYFMAQDQKAQIYDCCMDKQHVLDWIQQFLQIENYGFYEQNSEIYQIENCPFKQEELDTSSMESVIQDALMNDSSQVLSTYLDMITEKACREKILPHMVKDFMLDFLLSIKYYLKKYDQKESFTLLRNVKLEMLQDIQDMDNLLSFVKNKLDTTFIDIDLCFYKQGKSLVFKTNAFTEKAYQKVSFSVQEVADYLGISKNYFTSQYKEQAGIGFWEYVTDLRMEKAKELLLTTEEKSGIISRMVGYESEYHFSRKFKEYTGESPNQYRKNVENSKKK